MPTDLPPDDSRPKLSKAALNAVAGFTEVQQKEKVNTLTDKSYEEVIEHKVVNSQNDF